MLAGTTALLGRSIREDARKPRAHLLRIGAVGLLLVMLFGAQIRAAIHPTGGAAGLEFFQGLAWLGVILIALAGIGPFAGAITEEKEEGTLGLLLMAGVSPLAILLGKSTNRLFSALLLFVAIFPFTLLGLTLGGLGVGQIVATLLALAANLYLVANLALLVSVLAPRTASASAWMTLLILLMQFGPWLLLTGLSGLALQGYVATGSLAFRLAQDLVSTQQHLGISAQLLRIFDPLGEYSLVSWQFFWSLVVGTVCFAAAWILFEGKVQDLDAMSQKEQPRASGGFRWFQSTSRPGRFPLVWKDFRFVAGGPILLAVKTVLFGLLILLAWINREAVEAATWTGLWGTLRLGFAILLSTELIALSAQLYHVERHAGTLSTLLMLPKSVTQITCGKVVGCLLFTLPTAALVVLFSVVRVTSGESTEWLSVIDTVWICGLLLLCQATVMCSLIVRWGALPLAAATLVLTVAVLGPIFGMLMTVIRYHSGLDSPVAPLIYLTALASLAMQVEIIRRIHLEAGS